MAGQTDDVVFETLRPVSNGGSLGRLADAVGAAIGVIFYFALRSFLGSRAYRPIASG